MLYFFQFFLSSLVSTGSKPELSSFNDWIDFKILWQAVFQTNWVKTIWSEKSASHFFSGISLFSLHATGKKRCSLHHACLLHLRSYSLKGRLWSVPCLHWNSLLNHSAEWGHSVWIQTEFSSACLTMYCHRGIYSVLALCLQLSLWNCERCYWTFWVLALIG